MNTLVSSKQSRAPTRSPSNPPLPAVHVLIIPSWYPTSEAPLNGIYFAEQAQCLSRHGLQVGVVYPEQQSLRRLSWSALREKHFQTDWTDEHGIPTLRRYGWNVLSRFPPGLRCRIRNAVRLARRYVERYGVPDVLHAQSGRWAGVAAARIGRQYSVPFALTEHYSGFFRDAIFSWRRPLVRKGYRHAAVCSAVSTSLRDALASKNLAAASDIRLHPNLAPTSLFSPPPDGRPVPPPFHVVTIARLSLRKNVGGLLEAVASLVPDSSDSGPSPVLSVVGDGPERSRLEQKAQHLGIRKQVRFLGHLDRGAVRDVLRKAHAFVLPSLHETFGVVLLEAMATGLPVVATKSGGPEDLVTPETGLLVPPDDPEALREALRTLRRTWSSFDATTIHRYIHEQYGPEAFVERTQSLYRQALETAGT